MELIAPPLPLTLCAEKKELKQTKRILSDFRLIGLVQLSTSNLALKSLTMKGKKDSFDSVYWRSIKIQINILFPFLL